jgi:hypothetical protein
LCRYTINNYTDHHSELNLIGVFQCDQTTANGFSTFDLADIYGPAEEYVGAFSKGSKSKDLAKRCNVSGRRIVFGGIVYPTKLATFKLTWLTNFEVLIIFHIKLTEINDFPSVLYQVGAFSW